MSDQQGQQPDNPYWRRQRIDRAINFRKDRAPWDITPVRVKMTPRELWEALGYPLPRGPHPVPNATTYRGYRVEALIPENLNPA